MRTLILITALVLSTQTLVKAQQSTEKKIKEIEERRTEFVISFMKLTPEEAQKFKPLYKQYLHDIRKIHHKRKELRQKLKQKSNNLTEAEAKQAVEQWLKLEEEKQEIIRRYYQHIFPKAIPYSKIIVLPVAERKFKKELLKEMKERK